MAAEIQARSDIELAEESVSNSSVVGTPSWSEPSIPAVVASNAASSAGKPVKNQSETSTLSELRSRLECKASQTDVKEFLANLRIFEEVAWHACTVKPGTQCHAEGCYTIWCGKEEGWPDKESCGRSARPGTTDVEPREDDAYRQCCDA